MDTIKDTRARVDAVPDAESFAYGWLYQFWEQYLNLEDNLYMVDRICREVVLVS